MKRLVNGQEADLQENPEGVTTDRLHDRLVVKTPEGAFSAVAVREGDKTLVSYKGRQYMIEKPTAAAKSGGPAKTGAMKAPMPGLVVDVLTQEGAQVKKGDKLLVIEAMKVQQPYLAPFDGIVKQLPAKKGEQVDEGVLLVLVEPLE
jgi:acetyl/propionyl-CoA carboxylase alpha subunit